MAEADPMNWLAKLAGNDPEQWSVEIRDLPLHRIRVEPEISPRLALSKQRVREFAQLMREGGVAALPPIVVGGLEEDGRYPLGDGRHRLEAAHRIQAPSIRAAILTGVTPRELFAIAVRLSAKVPQAFNNREKRRVVFRLLEAYSEALSCRELAELSGTSHEFVARCKRDQARGLAWDTTRPARRTAEQEAARLLAAFETLWETVEPPELLVKKQQALARAAGDRYLDPARELKRWAEWVLEAAARVPAAKPPSPAA